MKRKTFTSLLTKSLNIYHKNDKTIKCGMTNMTFTLATYKQVVMSVILKLPKDERRVDMQ